MTDRIQDRVNKAAPKTVEFREKIIALFQSDDLRWLRGTLAEGGVQCGNTVFANQEIADCTTAVSVAMSDLFIAMAVLEVQLREEEARSVEPDADEQEVDYQMRDLEEWHALQNDLRAGG